jgi:hypothetical protein
MCLWDPQGTRPTFTHFSIVRDHQFARSTVLPTIDETQSQKVKIKMRVNKVGTNNDAVAVPRGSVQY